MKLLLFFGLSYDVFAETVPKASGREGIPVLTDKVGEEGALDGENNKENLPNEPSGFQERKLLIKKAALSLATCRTWK